MKRKNSKLSHEDLDEISSILDKVYKNDAEKCLSKHIDNPTYIFEVIQAFIKRQESNDSNVGTMDLDMNEKIGIYSFVIGMLAGIRYKYLDDIE